MCAWAPIASEGANRPATGLQTGTRQRGHRPQPRQVRRKPDRRLTKHTPTGRAETSAGQLRISPHRHAPWADAASVPRHGP
jgi:hypothetical protein